MKRYVISSKSNIMRTGRYGEQDIITYDMVAQAYKDGIISLDVDPNMEFGTVASIGDYWFYFGGFTADEMNPDEFKRNVPEEDIIAEIFETLEDFRFNNPDEYSYYAAIL